MDLHTRVRKVLSNKGMTQEELANIVGISQTAISDIVIGKTKKPRNILEIATALGVSVEWLKTGEGEVPECWVNEAPPIFKIDLYDFELSAGDGIINPDYPDVIASIHLTEEGLSRILGRKSAEGVCIFKVPTDSMAPTIRPCDLVFIDTNVKSYIGEGVYAFRVNECNYIKRLQRLPTGVIRALSDNKLYEPFDITEELFNSAEIIGKFIRIVPIDARDL